MSVNATRVKPVHNALDCPAVQADPSCLYWLLDVNVVTILSSLRNRSALALTTSSFTAEITTKGLILTRLFLHGSPHWGSARPRIPGLRSINPLPAAQHLCRQVSSSVMAPKRPKDAGPPSPSKKAKSDSNQTEGKTSALVNSLINDDLLGQTYCEELGIDLSSGSNAVFQWLACSSMFGSRLSEVGRAYHVPQCSGCPIVRIIFEMCASAV